MASVVLASGAMAAGLADHDSSVAMTIIERLAAIEPKRPGS